MNASPIGFFRTAEQHNLYSLIQAHQRKLDGPLLLEGGTGLGKTRAYLAAIFGAARAGFGVAVVLPTHQLIDQLLASSDLAATRGEVTTAAFRPERFFEGSRKDYVSQKRAAINAQVMVCTSASVIIDQRLGGEYNGVTLRDYIVFDEADQLPDMAALQSDFSVGAEDLANLGISLTTAPEALTAILAKPSRAVEPEVRAAARIILDAINEPAWFQKAGIDDEQNIVLTHKLPGRLLKNISNKANVAFVSATLTVAGKFTDFCSAMGIEQVSSLSSIIEPRVHGTLDFRVRALEVDTPEWVEGVVSAIAGAEKPVLVATTSHELSEMLGERLKAAVVRSAEETAAQASQRCAGGILIAAGAWAGLDTPLRWRSIVVPRVPFGQPTVVDGAIVTSYIDARNTAIRRLRQVIGRGLRSPDAVCTIYLMDGRAESLAGFVPERFTQAWTQRDFLEGSRQTVSLSKAERDPSVRRHALQHYGCICMACGFKPKVLEQLQVHHLEPISEGLRRTRLEDVAVLCALCHILAHTKSPPIELERLRKMADPGLT